MLVDLSDCTFIDSTVIGALVVAYQTLERTGGASSWRSAPAARAIRVSPRITGLTTFLVVHETRGAGLASLGAAA